MSYDHHIEDIDAYCAAVLEGTRPANKYEKLAIQRQINDLARQGTEKFPYIFNKDLAIKVIRFIECLPHVKGKWAARRGQAKRIKLEPWQKFNVGVPFGWVHKDTGFRRFRIIYQCIPRKNAKSTLAVGVGLYLLVEDGEFGAEVYCGATSEKQAWEIFRPAKQMVERTPGLRQQYGITAHARKLECDSVGLKPRLDGSKRFPDGSRFEPIIGKPGDGASPSCAILDEVHEHQDAELYDTMLTGMGAREQPFLWMITTAGSNINGPCYEIQQDLQKVLEGKPVNEELFGIIYTIDKDDDWKTEEALIKANPNYAVSVGEDFLKARQRDAIQSSRKQSIFQTKHLCRWVHAKNAWMNMLFWHACEDSLLDSNDFAGEKAWLGLDLSSNDDLTGVVNVFRREIDSLDHYYFFGRYYCTEEKVKGNDDYQGWVYDGHLVETEGDSIDYSLIEEHIESDTEKFVFEQCFYDPHGAANLAQRVQQNFDIEAVKVPQSFTNFSAAMRDFEGLVKSKRIHHNGNPALNWMLGNVVAKQTDDGKMMRPIKENRDSKIDGAVAMLMAFIGAYRPDEDDGQEKAMADYLTYANQ